MTSSDSDNELLKKKKRGVRNTEKYKHVIIKTAKIKGLPHLYYKGRRVPRRRTEEACRLNVKHVRQGYGMTELTLAPTVNLSNEIGNGTVGNLMPGFKSKVIDIQTNKPLGPYQRGELCFKSGMIMKGYIGNREATANMLDQDGFICTGDVGYYDEDGFFYIVDRIKELIKYKGFQVPPAELEAILLQHPEVRDAGVTGVPDEHAGELPMAFIVKQPNANVTEKDIIDFVASKVTPSKYLRGGVKFVDEIPKNPSGKILRKKLKENVTKTLRSKM